MDKENTVADKNSDQDESKFQLICAAIMAIFASIGVLSSTYSAITGTGFLNSSQLAAQAYSWYQAKSIKETILNTNKDFSLFLKKNLAESDDKSKAIDEYTAALDKDIQRLDNEKSEILKGSKNIDQSKWSQEVEGQLGQIIGAKEIDVTTQKYGLSSDYFTYATIYIQLCLVIGALALIVSITVPRNIFFVMMVGLGLYGTYLSIQGYILYSAIV